MSLNDKADNELSLSLLDELLDSVFTQELAMLCVRCLRLDFFFVKALTALAVAEGVVNDGFLDQSTLATNLSSILSDKLGTFASFVFPSTPLPRSDLSLLLQLRSFRGVDSDDFFEEPAIKR